MKTSDFDYELPIEFIAQTPIEPRDASRLMVLDRRTGSIAHASFSDLGIFVHRDDTLILNETRVIPARLYGHKIPSGGRIELLLIRRRDLNTWEALVGGKGLNPGRRVQVEGGPEALVIEALEGPRRLVRFEQPIEKFFNQAGHVPLPPYIHAALRDPERYQTVYSQSPGSVAAPTAGLHFTDHLMDGLQQQGVRFGRVTLHVGLDTFAPVNEETPLDHQIHTEWCQVNPATARLVNQTHQEGKKVIAVGTTSVRTLESAACYADQDGSIAAFEGSTDLFILPGYRFRAVDAMITNFHLPRSTLLMLVSAFAGRELILSAYEEAKRNHYRFYSFGDAMLIV